MPNMKKALINIVHDRHFTRDDPTNWVIKCNNKECHYYIELGPYAYDEYLFILDDNKVIILNKGVRETLIGKTLEFFWPGSIRFGTNYICKDCLKTSFIDNDERYECEHCKKRNLVTGDYSVGKLCPKCIKGKFIKDSLLPDGTFFGTDHLYDPNHIYCNRIPSSKKEKK